MTHKLYTSLDYSIIQMQQGGTEISTDPIFAIIKQDLEVAKKAANDEDFSLVNIIGNRIMSNLFVIDKHEMMIIGWMVRELGLELQSIKQKKDDKFIDAKSDAEIYLSELKSEIAKGNTDFKTYWEKFINIDNKLRKHLLSKHEKSIYETQPDFSRQSAIKSLEYFYTNKNMLLVEHNNFPLTIANELGRMTNEHGSTESVVIYLVLRAFDNYYRYLYYERFVVKNEELAETAKIRMNEHVEHIYKLKHILENNSIDDLYNESAKILSRLGADYRSYYLIYYGYSRIRAQEAVEEERIELSQETKQKIGDLITASLQEKLK